MSFSNGKRILVSFRSNEPSRPHRNPILLIAAAPTYFACVVRFAYKRTLKSLGRQSDTYACSFMQVSISVCQYE